MMAESMETLEIEVKHKASGATNEIDKLADALLRLNRILAGTTIPKLHSLADALKRVTDAQTKMEKATSSKAKGSGNGNAVSQLSESTKDGIRNLKKYEVAWLKFANERDKMEAALSKGDAVGAVYGRDKVIKAREAYNKAYWDEFGEPEEEEKASVWERISSTLSEVQTRLKGVAKETDKAAKGGKKAEGAFSKMLNSFKRIAVYRALRKVISEISKAAQEGLQNAYAFSQMIGSSISQTMDRITSLSLTMKNQFGAALGELLTTIQPILEYVIQIATKIADALAQFFAVLGGRSTYHKATDATAKWVEQTEKGAEAAQEWKNQLMGFDEINRLEAPSDTGSGSGGAMDNIGNWALSPVTMDFSWLDKIKEFFAGLDLEPLMNALGRLKEVALDLFETVKQWIGYIWDNILAPFITWIVEELAPVVVQVIASILEVFNALMEVLGPVLTEIWENVLAPLFEWIGEVVITILESLTNYLHDFAQLITGEITFDDFLNGLSDTEIAIGTFITAIGLAFLGVGLFNGIISIASTVVGVLSGALAFLAANPIVLVIAAIAAIIAIVLLAIKHWDEWKQKLQEWADKFSECVGNGKIEWEDFVYAIIRMAQWAIDKIEKIIDAVKKLINWIKEAARKIKEVFGGSGGGTSISGAGFSGSGGSYASGGWPDEGQMFIAREAGPEMVGTIGSRTAVATNNDIVAAIEGGVYNAMASVMSSVGSSRNGGSVIFNVNGREFMRAIWDDQRAVAVEHGVSLVTNG